MDQLQKVEMHDTLFFLVSMTRYGLTPPHWKNFSVHQKNCTVPKKNPLATQKIYQLQRKILTTQKIHEHPRKNCSVKQENPSASKNFFGSSEKALRTPRNPQEPQKNPSLHKKLFCTPEKFLVTQKIDENSKKFFRRVGNFFSSLKSYPTSPQNFSAL